MTGFAQADINFTQRTDGVYRMKSEMSPWQKKLAVWGVVGLAAFGTAVAGVAGLNEAIRQEDLRNCEQKPHTLACQERYNGASAGVQLSTTIEEIIASNDTDGIGQVIKSELALR